MNMEDKFEFQRKYDIKIIDKPSIEEIMLLQIRGEK